MATIWPEVRCIAAGINAAITLCFMIKNTTENRSFDPGGSPFVSSTAWSLCFKLWDPGRSYFQLLQHSCPILHQFLRLIQNRYPKWLVKFPIVKSWGKGLYFPLLFGTWRVFGKFCYWAPLLKGTNFWNWTWDSSVAPYTSYILSIWYTSWVALLISLWQIEMDQGHISGIQEHGNLARSFLSWGAKLFKFKLFASAFKCGSNDRAAHHARKKMVATQVLIGAKPNLAIDPENPGKLIAADIARKVFDRALLYVEGLPADLQSSTPPVMARTDEFVL